MDYSLYKTLANLFYTKSQREVLIQEIKDNMVDLIYSTTIFPSN